MDDESETNLVDYVTNHTDISGEGSGTDVVFFNISICNDPNAEVLKTLIEKHKGVFCDLNLFDHKEHGYIEIGAWIIDQPTALRLMVLGDYLKLWDILTPPKMLPGMLKDVYEKLAMRGLITIIPRIEMIEYDD